MKVMGLKCSSKMSLASNHCKVSSYSKDSQLVGYIEDDQSESNVLEVFLKNEPSI